ncbi:hypothetical protein EYF80_053277 [Liparis tanakae]|uniref:Uncharacterized protein n=1 Tax=Liparis tanakae TaxID=230148 RepID=A0A4Z2F6R0_9TELE|nr:hypothetical protein EYF80_053277 [Liparis tanakae]
MSSLSPETRQARRPAAGGGLREAGVTPSSSSEYKKLRGYENDASFCQPNSNQRTRCMTNNLKENKRDK